MFNLPDDERSARTTAIHRIEIDGRDKYVSDVWAMRDRAYEEKWGKPVSKGLWPFVMADQVQEKPPEKVVKMKRTK